MSYQLQEINRRIDQDVKGFLEECDAQYAQKVSQAADAILTNLPHSPIVLLSGPSGSGRKTVFQQQLKLWRNRSVRLTVGGIRIIDTRAILCTSIPPLLIEAGRVNRFEIKVDKER